ncbi:hypothetical protein VdG2_07238 [Verticillium dahliae VDG2]|nr:hypothetical protein VdG2_07238 [Verticillium dahliae VDG2]
MARILKLGWLSLAIASVAASSDAAPSQETTKWSAFEHVNEAQFRKAIKENPYSLVAFTTRDWQPTNFDSEALEWEWPAIKEKEPNVLSVDCSAEPDLCLEHDVRAYPALRFYRSGSLYARYRGPRKASSILPYMQRIMRPVVDGLEAANLTSFKDSDDVVFILHLRSQDAGRGLYKRFHDLAEEFHDRYTFAIASRATDGSADELGEDAPSVLRCFNHRDGREAELDHFFQDVGSLRRFVVGCGERLVKQLTRLNAWGFTEGTDPVLYYFDADPEARDRFADDMLPVAKEHAGRVTLVAVDPFVFPEVVNRVGLPWDFPSLALQNPATKTMSLFNKAEINAGVVGRFIADVLQLNPPAQVAAAEEVVPEVPEVPEIPEDEGVVLEDKDKEHDEL